MINIEEALEIIWAGSSVMLIENMLLHDSLIIYNTRIDI